MKDEEFISALKNIAEHILLNDISMSEIESLLTGLEIYDIWDSDNLMITDCYYGISHMVAGEEHISKREWEYYLECFDHQRSFDIEEKLKITTTFPDKLDDAVVVEFSDFGNFGTVNGDGRTVRYFAICQYPNDEGYHLFFCDGHVYDYDVITSDHMGSIEECRESASRYGDVVWHKK